MKEKADRLQDHFVRCDSLIYPLATSGSCKNHMFTPLSLKKLTKNSATSISPSTVQPGAGDDSHLPVVPAGNL